MMSVDIKHKALDVLSKFDSDVGTPSEKNALSAPYKSLERVRVDRGPLEDSGDHEMISEEKSITTFKTSPSTDSLRRSLSKLNFFKNRRTKSLDEDEISSQRNRSTSDPDDGFVDSDDEYEETFSKDKKKKNKRKSTKKDQLPDEKSKESWWNRWANHIKYSIISKETEEAFLQIVVLLKLFLKDVEIKPLDITMCLALMSTYHTSMTGMVRTELMVTDVALAQKMHRYMKFACAAYGWKLINGYKFAKQIKGVIEGIKLKDEANSRVLLTHTNILIEDIVSVNWSSGHFHPGHFIAIDHSTKAVVVSIRGTFHVKDCLTDLIAHYEKFMGGYAHTGILMAARRKYKDLTPTILENMKKYPDYKLVLVGHSLGAGTASLLAMMLYNDYNLPIHCYAYAPPCVVSLDLAKRCQSFVTSIVVNDDIVPRLSWGSMEDLRKIIVHLLNQKENNLQRFFQFLSAGNNLGESLTSRLSTYFKCQPTPDLGTTKMELSTRLYPPGTVYHIFKESKILSPKYNLMEESSPSLFGDIIISPCMFTDHMPDTYEECLGLVVDRLVQEQQKQQE